MSKFNDWLGEDSPLALLVSGIIIVVVLGGMLIGLSALGCLIGELL